MVKSSEEGADFTETEVALGVQGAARTDCLPTCLLEALHQRQRLLPGVKQFQIGATKMRICLS